MLKAIVLGTVGMIIGSNIEGLLGIAFMRPIIFVSRKSKILWFAISGILSGLGIYLAILLIFSAFKYFSLGSASLFAMLLFVLISYRDVKRINNIKKGRSTVKYSMRDELNNYNQKHELIKEYSALFGTAIGFVLGSLTIS